MLNLFSVLFIVEVISKTTEIICQRSLAKNLINLVEAVPFYPRRMFLISCVCCLLLLLDFLLRQLVFPKNDRGIYVTLLFDALIIVFLMVLMNCNYNGIVLWILANIVYYIDNKRKYLALGLGILIYMVSNFGMLNAYFPLYSIQSYIFYYSWKMQQLLFFVYYLISALNLIVFVIFCVYVIQEQKNIVAEVNALYEQLRHANEELKAYADIKEKMGETKERNRLAREIHDTLGHSLMAISVGIDACLAIIDSNPQKAKKQLEIISSVTRDGINDVRKSVSSLRPDALKSESLKQNLQKLIERTCRATGVSISFDCCEELNFEEDEANAIFRVAQESVTNAIRHGNATKIGIRITRKNDLLTLSIADNGVGCKEFKSGFGIMHMKERISLLHGTIEFVSEKGVTVTAMIPLREGGRNDKSHDS